MPDIPVWNKCDNKCVMCTNEPAFALQAASHYTLKNQVEKLERWLRGIGSVYLKNAGRAEFVSLTGGEPTLHPDLFKLLAYFRLRLPGVPITLLSNGRRFGNRAFAEKFCAAARPPFSVAIALHGPSAAVHDAISGVRGSFAQTVRGFKNLLSLPGAPFLEIRLVLHKKNISALDRTLRFLLKTFPATAAYRVTAIHYEIEGMSLANHRKVALPLSASAAKLGGCLPLIKQFSDFRLYHFPLCVLRKELRPLCWITLPPEDRLYPARVCGRCTARKKCLGLMAEYAKFFGDGELKALK
ncbi:MAG: radical SAM protein [Elusimicrobiales bacterium]|nr:radical SAM protein [Elusimicrobiales bacterium]